MNNHANLSQRALERIKYRVEQTDFRTLLNIMETEFNMSAQGLRILLTQAGAQVENNDSPLWYVVDSHTIDRYKARKIEPTQAQLAGSAHCWSNISKDDAEKKFLEMMK